MLEIPGTIPNIRGAQGRRRGRSAVGRVTPVKGHPMTYTFKLARRLARFRAAALLPVLLLLLSCGEEGPSGTGPSSANPAGSGLTIRPDEAAVGVDGSVQFSAERGTELLASAKGGHGRGRGNSKPGSDALSVTPGSVTLEPNTVQRFTASLADATVAPSVRWSATGGTIDSSGRYTAGRTPGQYRVVATSSDGQADTASTTVVADAPALDRVVLSPATAYLAAGETQQFSAVGKASDGSSVAITPKYSARGGTITAAGLYTAGETAGTYRVFVTDSATGKADTASVGITAASPTLQALVLTPANVSLVAGGTQQFTATGKSSDGSTAPITATFLATGGTITSSGLFTAGATAGNFRVVAVQSGGTLADTAAVSVTATAPAPTNGNTYLLAGAESGTTSPWNYVFGNPAGVNPAPAASKTRVRSGAYSYKHEVTTATNPSSSMVMSFKPQVDMGCPYGRYCGEYYYSFWAYIDAGFTDRTWNMILGWMTGGGDAGGNTYPISHIGLELWDGQLQLVYYLKNCAVGLYACPTIANYAVTGGDYRMTAQSPSGIVPFPRGQWVHVAVRYKMAATNGRVTIWQDGDLIMDLTAPTMNTRGGHSNNLQNPYNNMVLQFGMYQGPAADLPRRMYVDDFKVTDFRPIP
jgi:hypothetical protein